MLIGGGWVKVCTLSTDSIKCMKVTFEQKVQTVSNLLIYSQLIQFYLKTLSSIRAAIRPIKGIEPLGQLYALSPP